MESPMLTRIKRKEQTQPAFAQVIKEFIILKAALLVAAIAVIIIITKLG